jgi:hypothetical protein
LPGIQHTDYCKIRQYRKEFCSDAKRGDIILDTKVANPDLDAAVLRRDTSQPRLEQFPINVVPRHCEEPEATKQSRAQEASIVTRLLRCARRAAQ